MLKNRLGGSRNVSMSVCRALLAQMKTHQWTDLKFDDSMKEQEESMKLLNEIMRFALQAENEIKSPDIAFMSELERVVQIRQQRDFSQGCVDESSSVFLKITIKAGLLYYTKYRLNLQLAQGDSSNPQRLMYALRQSLVIDRSQPIHLADMIRLLYQHGTRHVRRHRNLLVWQGFLDSYSEWFGTTESEYSANWTEKMKLLLALGADIGEVWRGKQSWYTKWLC